MSQTVSSPTSSQLSSKTKNELIQSSPLAWVVLNNMVTENQKKLEFKNHKFLIDLYADMHDDIVVRKSAQVGESVERIIKALWCAKYLGVNIIYVLPTKNIVTDFVVPKVNPIINSNPEIRASVSSDSQTLKQVGDRFIYFTGAFSETAAIMKSADILILDELDRMPDMSIVNMFDSRLQASTAPKRWRLSNPSQVGFGVDGLYNDSDQRHWFFTCHHCGFKSFIDFEQHTYEEIDNHYVNKELAYYACGKCHDRLSNADRRNGDWVARYPKRHRHGYWISQMMAPWVSAQRILEQEEESTVDFFYNFVLGKAYTPSDLLVNREAILQACAPSRIERLNVAMGVDQAADGQFYVLMTSQGMFEYGKTKSWEEIETIKLMYNATVVVDPNPYPTMPKRLAGKYSDFYMCYFKESKTMDILTWKGQVVSADRTRLLDTVAYEIINAKMMFRQRPQELEAYIADWNNIYRTTKEEDDGRTKSIWMKKENKNSDYSFATAYARAALSQIMGGMNSSFVEPEPVYDARITDELLPDGLTETTLTGMVQETLEQFDD